MSNYQEASTSYEFVTEPKRTEDTAFINPNIYKAVITDCLNSWVNYLQVLNNLCSAGFKLSQCLSMLAQAYTIPLASQCQASWEELGKATIIASNSVKTHIAAAMQDMILRETFTESDAHRQQEHNQHIISENLLTFINLQYQFSIATCECFGAMATCPNCQSTSAATHETDCSIAALQQCFSRLYSQDTRSQTSSPHSGNQATLDSPRTSSEIKVGDLQRGQSPSIDTRGPSPIQGRDIARGPSPIQNLMGHIETLRGPFPNPGQLHTMKGPFLGGRGSRSPLQFPLFPLNNQRRWSEAAAGEVSTDSGDGTMRRWSMPWDCAKVETVPWHNRVAPISKLALPGNSSHERSRSNTPVEPACNTAITSSEGLADAIQLLSSRPLRSNVLHMPHTSSSSNVPYSPMWPDSHQEDRIHKRHYPLHNRGGNWQYTDSSQTGAIPRSAAEQYDIFPTNVPLTSRKSSSSTDSSSCLSIHSRSASGSDRSSDGAGESIRSHPHLYSIWSGSDHLPFIRLTESQEPSDDNDVDNTPNNKGSYSMFPKPI